MELAHERPCFASANAEESSRIAREGGQSWRAPRLPAFIQVDLERVALLSSCRVELPEAQRCQYRVYGSVDGRDYDFLGEKRWSACDPEESIPLQGQARFVRVFLESVQGEAAVRRLSVFGEPLDTPLIPRPEVEIPSFDQSEFAVPTRREDALKELPSLVCRVLGTEYLSWFQFVLGEGETDFFTISQAAGGIRIEGNNGVSLAAGLNHYLKYFCNVSVTQTERRIVLPKRPVPVPEPVTRQTPCKLRYAYNYCTHSYTMAFWGEREWQRELDWLALNGVNLVLDLTGLEEVWRRFLGRLGYTLDEIKNFLTGPAYFAWLYMANITNFGGPLPDGWFARRTALARKNQRFMQRMGMTPVRQIFNGMVPEDFPRRFPRIPVIPQGLWNDLPRPLMLKTTGGAYAQLADVFYQCQREVFGEGSHYYAGDPFHEGGQTGGMRPKQVSQSLLDGLLRFDPQGVWVIQAWGANPTRGLLRGLRGKRKHALVLDLYAEKNPRWRYWHGREFQHTPWIYCMLNNFGGRMGLHGHMDAVFRAVPKAKKARCCQGVGITCEASQSNPVLFDLLFELPWQEAAKGSVWLESYQRRRYGTATEHTKKAWNLLLGTVYRAQYNQKGEGAPESVGNARPGEVIRSASTWGNAKIGYSAARLEEAGRELLADYDALQNSAGYRRDLADVLEQILVNRLSLLHQQMAEALRQKNAEGFRRASGLFLNLLALSDGLMSSQEEYRLDTWLHRAQRCADGTDDLTRRVFELNARMLITTWASREACDGGLKDYSNRQWGGLIKGYYLPRWERWIAVQTRRLNGADTEEPDWFSMEWAWVLGGQEGDPSQKAVDLRTIGQKILEDPSDFIAIDEKTVYNKSLK